MYDDVLLLPASLAAVSFVSLLAQAVVARRRKEGVVKDGKDPMVVRVLDATRLTICLVLVGFIVWEISANLASLSKAVMYSLLAFFVYNSILSSITLFSNSPRARDTAALHLSVLLFVPFLLFLIRDVWPLAYAHRDSPVHSHKTGGWLPKTQLTLIGIVGFVIPGFRPAPFRESTSEEDGKMVPHPAQVASPFSFFTFSFMDPLIFEARRTPHLAVDALPPIVKRDRAENITAVAYPYLDPVKTRKKHSLLWGLSHIYWREYIFLATMILIHVAARFASPLGLKYLLTYLEHSGDPLTQNIRPWVWIVMIAVAPMVSSFAWEHYLYVTTTILVQTEAILTQLVFDHSLRIRMNSDVMKDDKEKEKDAKSTPPSSNASASTTPESSRPSSPTPSSSAEGSTLVDTESTTSTKVEEKDQKKKKEEMTHLVGQINNLVSTDLKNVKPFIDCLNIPAAFITIGVALWFLYELLGWSALVGTAVMLGTMPAPAILGKFLMGVQKEKMKKTDKRVQTVTTNMGILRMIKFFAWEKKMLSELSAARDEELSWVRYGKVLELSTFVINEVMPLSTMVATYGTYTLVMKQELTVSTVFSSLAVFNMLRDQIYRTTYLLPQILRAKVSLDRFDNFFKKTEPLEAIPEGPVTDKLIGFRDCNFTWNDESAEASVRRRDFRLVFTDELIFHRGRINLIVGPTASGKTSLLLALLGEMRYQATGQSAWCHLPRSGGISYAAQESWVLNRTVRDNILFGEEYDEERYKKVLAQTALERDLKLFEAGDMTEVGEKGLTLSGGQKARVSLARAVYSPAEIILLDDILAALDVHTAKWIVDKCLKGDLVQGRTVLLVTHNVALCRPIAHFVVSLKHGRVVNAGSMAEVLQHDKFLAKELRQNEKAIEKEEVVVDEDPPTEGTGTKGRLTVPEEIAMGHVSWKAIALYAFAAGNVGFWVTCMSGHVISFLLNLVQQWYLGYWASQYQGRPASEVSAAFYLGIYAAIALGDMISSVAAWAYWIFGTIRASRAIHRMLLESIFGATLRWLDVVPQARVISRCTQDMQAIDGPFSMMIGHFCAMSLFLLMYFLGVVYMASWPAVLAGAFVAVGGGFVGNSYLKAQLAVKREMSNARSPVLSHFNTAVTGVVSIRAYAAQKAFVKTSMEYINIYTRTARTYYNLNRWMAVRMDIFGSVFVASVAAYLVYGGRDIGSSNIGFTLTIIVGFSHHILFLVRIYNEVEVQANSMERIQDFLDIEHEPEPTAEGTPPAYWPASGALHVENLTAQYAHDAPLVLNNISFVAKAGERVAVVGRTGAGKSTIALALLRTIPTNGTVLYDGRDTSKINLDALRSAITLIPQQPELLTGTLRENLDPFGQYEDAALNDALRSAGLSNLQASHSEEGSLTLDSKVESGGSNLSLGQRQIAALARALVRNSKLVILDEATAAIDYDTDNAIQKSIRTELPKDTTVITIAHRLQTIMDYDKVMVLDSGNLVEYDSPRALLERKDGFFKSLVDESLDKEVLYSMIEKK